jgi:CubicO group peptidase (beta-lactamase class C family)
MKRRQFVLGGVGALGASFVPRANGIPELEALIQRRMQEADVPGLSIAVIREGRLFWRRAFGVRDRASKQPVDDATVFEMASVSKTVFAYAAMKLCDSGIIGLDTPLTSYAPDLFPAGDPRLRLITARHVLSHTTGLPNWRSKQEPLATQFAPGERYQYSGEGYFYLQTLVTRLKGRTDGQSCGRYEADFEVCATDFDRYMKANLLEPFGMASSGYVWNERFERRSARPHDAAGKPLETGKPTATGAARYGAAGGLHTTATDYAAFLAEVIAPRPADAFRLTEMTRQEMLRPQVRVDKSSSWALGWEVRHTPARDLIQHQGGQRGFQAFTAAAVDRKAGYVVLTNSDNGWKVFYDERFSELVNRLILA